MTIETVGTDLVGAARMILQQMGVDPADLTSEPRHRKPVPTFDEYIPIVAAAVSNSTRQTYMSYWNRVSARWGTRSILEPTPSEIAEFREDIKAKALLRRNSRGGGSAAESFIAALRCLYKHAEKDELITEAENPARRASKPTRQPTTRGALKNEQLAEINHVTATTGDDPELDTLLVRLHTETACRRGGALDLRPRDLDPVHCQVYLREKKGTTRWQPVSRTLMTALLDHAEQRGAADPETQLLRYRDGDPITYRRYDHLWDRLGRHLPWVRTLNVSTHWLRHTTLTWVERNYGFAVAHRYAGHHDATDHASATMTYVKATVEDVATALAALTGEPHPLAA